MNCSLIPAVAALLLAPPCSMAQQLYRCGNTYSQTPCALDATPARISSGAAPDSAHGPQGKELCASAAPQSLGLADPQGARIEAVSKGESEVIQYAGQPIVARKYVLMINAKNAYGAYEGARAYACFLSEDERRILKVAAQR